jgi:hypothetical protein
VYLIHFDRPIGNSDNPRGQASHYLGYASKSLKDRIAKHRAGNGSRLLQVVNQLGIDWRVVRTWSGNRTLERKLKNQHNAPKLCPVCQQLKKGANPMPKMIDLSKDLSASYVEKAERQVDLEQLEREIYKREIAITPAEGWPGKNAEIRDLEKAKTLAADPVWLELDTARQAQRAELALLEGAIAGMEAERRGFEWEIRQNLVTMLAANAVNRNGHGAIEDEAIDDVAGQTVDDETLYQVVTQGAQQVLSDDFPAPDPTLEDHSIDDAEEELPF